MYRCIGALRKKIGRHDRCIVGGLRRAAATAMAGVRRERAGTYLNGTVAAWAEDLGGNSKRRTIDKWWKMAGGSGREVAGGKGRERT